jgi:hypothetical protein
MSAVGFQLAIAGGLVWLYFRYTHPLWIFALLVALGSSVKFFAEAMILVDYPLSKLPLWPQAVCAVSFLEIAASTAMTLSLIARPETAARHLLDACDSPRWGLVLTVLIVGYALAVLSSGIAMLERASFKAGKLLTAMIATAKIGLFWGPVTAIWGRLFPDAWTPRAILSEQDLGVVAIAGVGSFVIDELVNVAVRKRRLTRQQFTATIAISYGICVAPAAVVPWLTSFLAGRAGVHSSWVQVILAVALSGLVTYVATRWLVQSHIQNVREVEHFEDRFG